MHKWKKKQAAFLLERHKQVQAIYCDDGAFFHRGAEHVQLPIEERTHGAGLLLAESMIGISNGLHSKAGVLLQLLLQEDVIPVETLKPQTAKVNSHVCLCLPCHPGSCLHVHLSIYQSFAIEMR